MEQPREYKNATVTSIMAVVLPVFIFAGFLILVYREQWLLSLFVFIVAITIAWDAIFLISKTIISGDEISTQNIFGIRKLKYFEISGLSTKGNSVSLYNNDKSIVITPSSTLPGYRDIVEWLFSKRPDLFNLNEYVGISKSWAGTLFSNMTVLVLIIGFWILFNKSVWINVFAALVIIISFAYHILNDIQSVTIQGDQIVFKYFFKPAIELPARDIKHINLVSKLIRDTRFYYLIITPKVGSPIQIQNLKPGLPVAYIILKNWHEQNMSSRKEPQQN